MTKNILMVVANFDFNETEYSVPRKIFEDNGFSVKVASSLGGKCNSSDGSIVSADLTLSDVNIVDYDAVVFVGGQGAEIYFNDQVALNLVKEFNYADKLTCAICLAPVILAKAGILKGKNTTVTGSSVRDLELADAVYTAQSVAKDDNIVTASGPDAAEEFAREIVVILMGADYS